MQLLPRHLKARLILIVSCVLLVTGAASSWLAARDQAQRMMEGMRANSAILVRNVAESCARYLLVEDYAELEALLVKSAELPDIRAFHLTEPDGKLIWHVDHPAGGLPQARTQATQLAPPAAPTAIVTDAGDRLVVWQPVVAGSLLGWLRADFSLASIREAQARVWQGNLILAVVWVGGSAILILLVLRPSVAAIGRLSAFATRLDERQGEQIAIGNQAAEIAELAAALNGASVRLQATERQLLDERESLRRANRELHAISNCNQVLIRAEDEQSLLDEICRIVCDEAGYRMAWVGYAEHDAAQSIRPMAWAGAEDGYLAHADIVWADGERGQGPTGTAIRSGKSIWVADFASDSRVAPWRSEAVNRGYRSSLAIPLLDERGRAFAALSIYAAAANAFPAPEIRLLEELAGDLAFGLGALRTRTERQRAEAALHRLNQDLERRVAERTGQLEAANQELEAFAYSVSHDLRGPLRHIDGFLRLLREDTAGSLDEDGRHFMDTIEKATRRMETLIDDLLAFSRLGRAEMRKTTVDLQAMVDDVVGELEPECHGRTIRWRIGELPLVAGDRAMLRVVLVNLLANAVKFTRQRATAEIEIGQLPATDGETVIFVRDNGAGFDMKYADKLFGVFERLHNADEFEGTGIGLANVRRVICRHGGRAWAEGKVDGGAVFYFSLPAAPAA